jgi:FAD:protein FMN transferase
MRQTCGQACEWVSAKPQMVPKQLQLYVIACLAFFPILGISAEDWKLYEFTQPEMGTLFRIQLYAPSKDAAETAALAAFKRVADLNRVCSDYLPNSELTKLCQAGSMRVSVDLFQVIEKAQFIARSTAGAFDITAGHMTNQWRRAKRKGSLPTASDMAKARALTGFQWIKLDISSHTVTLMKAGMQLDLGGIAKGYAADAALKVLRQQGLSMAVVAASGDISVGEPPPNDDKGWDIAVRTFESEEATDTLRHVKLKNCGISTSGDLHQSIEIEGVKYSHIVDVRTGLGLTQRIACSVIASDATTSDALATAMCVLGETEGKRIATQLGASATFVAKPKP